MKRYQRAVWLCLILWLLPAPLFPRARGQESSPAVVQTPAGDDEYYHLFLRFVDTLDQIERNYVQDITREELFDAAIKGMLSKLDAHSNYISQDEIQEFRTTVDNRFGGIGIQLRPDLTVATPLYGSPAYRAGIREDDRIVEIEGESTEGWAIDKAVERLKGEPGTKVVLSIRSPGEENARDVTLVREVVKLETVLGARRGRDDRHDFMLDERSHIAYIRVTSFSEDTARDLEQALRDVQEAGMRALVLDLRFNPGGLLSSAVRVSDLFLKEGEIVSIEGRNTARQVWYAHDRGSFEGFPMAVLVNRASASASEIVAACLQDHKRAVIVGERTWGKGSVQHVIELDGGQSALKLTTSGYRRPNGKNIHRFPESREEDDWGVRPDDGYHVRLNDNELVRLYTELQRRTVIPRRAAPGPGGEGDQREEESGRVRDRQLEKALEYLRQALGHDSTPS